MSRLLVRVLPVAAVLLATAACAPSAEPAPDSVDPATVAWVDQVCTALRPFADHIAAGPQADGPDASTAVAGLGSFLNTGATTLDGTVTALAAIGPSPAPGGDAVVDAMEARYTEEQAALQDAATQLTAVDVTDEAALATALPAALEGLPENFDPTAELRAGPELAPAVDRAASCVALPATAG